MSAHAELIRRATIFRDALRRVNAGDLRPVKPELMANAQSMETLLTDLITQLAGPALEPQTCVCRISFYEPDCPVHGAPSPSPTPEPQPVNRICGSQGVDEDGCCVRCGLRVDPDLEADRPECPPGFFMNKA